MIRTFIINIFLLVLMCSCAFKPLYKKTNNFHPNKINIIIKSKQNYENNLSIMKVLLNEKLNKKGSKNSYLKLIVSMDRSISINYSFYDKRGELLSGSLNGNSTFNYTTNNYANLISLEDASNKLVKSLSSDLSNLILAESLERKFQP